MPLPHHTATVLLRCRHPFRPTAAAQRRLLCQHVDSDSKYGKAEWEAYAERASGAPEPRALLQEVARFTRENAPRPHMMVSEPQGELLAMLVSLSGARAVLELGTFTGYSALCMASALPAGGRLVTCEIDPEMAEIARGFIAQASRQGLLREREVEVRCGDGVATLEALRDQGAVFDFAFVDADKRGYGRYHDLLMEDGGLLAEGGMAAYDNVMFKGRVIAAEAGEAGAREKIAPALHRFNLNVEADARLARRVLLPAWDGLTLVQKAHRATLL